MTALVSDVEFVPSRNRGVALLREVLDLVNAEVENAGLDADPESGRAGRWNQGSWGDVPSSAVASSATEIGKIYGDSVLPAAVVVRSCGTSACIAGHTSLLVGDSPVVSTFDLSARHRVDWAQVVPVDGANEGVVQLVGDRAQELLELTDGEASDLFFGNNSVEDVRTIAAQIIARVEDEAAEEALR